MFEILLAILVGALLLAGHPSSTTAPPPPPACGSVTDNLPRSLPPLTPPPRGGSYVDPTFGCRVTRLSDATAEGTNAVIHLYSITNPFNANDTYVLVQWGPSTMQIRDLRGNIIRDNLYRVGLVPTSNAVWHRTDPALLYFADGNSLKSYNVATDSAVTLRTFASYTGVSIGNGKGDLSWDGDHLPLLADGTFGFIYTISTGATTQAVNLLTFTGGVGVNAWDVTPSNGGFLLWTGGTTAGQSYFDPALNFGRQVTSFTTHGDVARDADGSDLIVEANAADPSPPADCLNTIVKFPLATGAMTCLGPTVDWSVAAYHVSCNNIGPWCLAESYRDATDWPSAPYLNELFQVPLNGSKVWVRLAHHRSTAVLGYEHQPRVSVSASGKYALFDSDMGGTVVDVYLLTLPAGGTPPVASTSPAPAAPARVSPSPVASTSPAPAAPARVSPSPATSAGVSGTVSTLTPTALVLSSITVVSVSSNSTAIGWTSRTPSDSQLEYGRTTAYGSLTKLDPTLTTVHVQILTRLAPGTRYHYRVKSRDAAGTLVVSEDRTFTTSPLPSR